MQRRIERLALHPSLHHEFSLRKNGIVLQTDNSKRMYRVPIRVFQGVMRCRGSEIIRFHARAGMRSGAMAPVCSRLRAPLPSWGQCAKGEPPGIPGIELRGFGSVYGLSLRHESVCKKLYRRRVQTHVYGTSTQPGSIWLTGSRVSGNERSAR